MHMKPARSLTIVSAAVVLSLTTTPPILGDSQARIKNPSATTSCKSAPLINSYSVDRAGKKVSPGSPGEVARKATYSLNGKELRTTAPPADFDAATASQSELARYHIPARPSGGSQLALWKKVHTGPNHTWVLPDHLCQSDRRHEISYPNVYSGLFLNEPSDSHNAWWDSAALFTEPTFNGVCPSASSYAMWPGIADDTHLIQAGTDVDPAGDGPNDDVAWYELIGPDEDTNSITIPSSDLAINAGDNIWVDVTYTDSADEVNFDIGNIATGKEYFVDFSSYDGHDAHYFYSGDRTEYVAERTTQHLITGDKILQLRQPQGNHSKWLQALGNRTILNYQSALWDKFYMTRDGTSKGFVLSSPSNIQATDSPSITWQDDWYGCS